MADQDFNIKVVTTADTSGIRQTSAELDKLKQQQATFAETARRQAAAAAAAAAVAPPTPISAGPTGATGAALGIGVIVTVLTSAWRQIKEFSDEQNKWVDGMIKAAEKSRELGLAVSDMLDAMKSSERIDTEPLEVSFARLKQKVTELKTEMQLAFAATDYEAVKRYAAALGVVESQLHHVTAALDQKAKASQKAAEEAEKDAQASAREAASFLKGAVQTAQPQVQAALKNEEAARQAREKGDEKSAAAFQKSADQLKASMTQGQREEYEGLTAGPRLGRKAGPGESQDVLDDIARNQINFQRQLAGQPPLPGKGETGGVGGNSDLSQAIQQAFDAAMAKYWGP